MIALCVLWEGHSRLARDKLTLHVFLCMVCLRACVFVMVLWCDWNALSVWGEEGKKWGPNLFGIAGCDVCVYNGRVLPFSMGDGERFSFGAGGLFI